MQWVWTHKHQLKNRFVGLCLAIVNGELVLRSCDRHVTDFQEWACGEYHLMMPSAGLCLTAAIAGVVPEDHLEGSIIRELQTYLNPDPTPVVTACRLHSPEQVWQLFATSTGRSRRPVCSSNSLKTHEIAKCHEEPAIYNNRTGQLIVSCRHVNTFVNKIHYPVREGEIGLECCASPKRFSGKKATVNTNTAEVCIAIENTICPNGYYMKKIWYSANGHTVVQVKCCTDAIDTANSTQSWVVTTTKAVTYSQNEAVTYNCGKSTGLFVSRIIQLEPCIRKKDTCTDTLHCSI